MTTEASVWGLYVQENMALFMLFQASMLLSLKTMEKSHCG